MSIARPMVALKDFRAVVRAEPGNKDAVEKLRECEKIVKRIQFEKAIEGGPPPSSFEGFNPDSLCMIFRFPANEAIEESYDGMRMKDGKMSRDFIDDMLKRFKENKRIHKDYVSPFLNN